MSAREVMCGVVVGSSWHDKVACAFPRGHNGNHSWASIPALPPLDANEAVEFWISHSNDPRALAARRAGVGDEKETNG